MKYNKFLFFVIIFLFYSTYAYAQAENTKPTADAGADRNVIVGEASMLGGSGMDVDKDPITFKWQLIDKPGGSLTSLSADNIPNPTAILDLVGPYVFNLRTNDGNIFSTPSSVVITANAEDLVNIKPVSYAGVDRNVNVGSMLTLTGFGSDIDGDSLIYIWVLSSFPAIVNVELSNSHIQSPTFTPLSEGAFTFSLIVNDGKEDSVLDQVTMTATNPGINRAPSADAGINKTVNVGSEVTLAGIGTDPDNDLLTFTWAVVSKPAGSQTILTNNNLPNPTFIPDLEGDYIFILTIDDGQIDSQPDKITYTAQIFQQNIKPTSDAGIDNEVNVRGRVELQGVGSDGDNDKMSFRWSILNLPIDSGALLSNPNILNPELVLDKIGTYTFQLIVNDGKEDSYVDIVNIRATELQQCLAGLCDLNTKQWCNNGVWSNVDYCSNCGNLDITCGSCVGSSCDVTNQNWCEDNVWKTGTYLEYCSHCSYIDFSCPICEENKCDIDNEGWCDNGRWSLIGYCDKCGKIDVSCGVACEDNACNTKDRKVCKNGIWQDSDYCISCGGKDSSCVFECLNNACDTKNQKWCGNEVWKSTNYCTKCGSKDVSCGVPCLNQVCDVASNRWCDGGSWSSLNYCEKCQDSECLNACVNGACDINVKKWCNNGVWSNVDYCDKCGSHHMQVYRHTRRHHKTQINNPNQHYIHIHYHILRKFLHNLHQSHYHFLFHRHMLILHIHHYNKSH